MIQLNCPHCRMLVKVADEYAGKKGRCPGCKEVFVIPAKAAAEEEDIPEVVAAAPEERIAEEPRPRRPVRRSEEEIEEERRPAAKSRSRLADDDEEEEEDRPRRKKKKRGPYADCPHCDARGYATRVGFTWWGGILGPALLTHVRCDECGTCYNGKHGDANTTRIAIYIGVSFAIAFGILVAMLIGGLLR